MKLSFPVILFIIFNASAALSQTRTVEATLVLNNNDTIKGEVEVWVNLFNKKLINELSFNKEKLLVRDGDLLIIKTEDINYLEFIDFYDRRRIFLSDHLIPNFSDEGLLYEKMIGGKLSWYRQYVSNTYDGSIIALEHYCLEDNKPVTHGVFAMRRKKQFKELTKDFPQLRELIENHKTYDDIRYFIEQFNTLSSEKGI